MAHVLVYLQRTPHGLHPGSATALCVARDLAEVRGASVTGICLGDGGDFDQHVIDASGRLGADQVFFVGPGGLREAHDRLRARHVLLPWTYEANSAVQAAGIGQPIPRWVGGPQEGDLEAVTAVVAGALPWRWEPEAVEPEYAGDVGEVPLPAWLRASGGRLHADPTLRVVAPPDLEPSVAQQLASLGAESVGLDYADRHSGGTLLWLDAGPNGLPPVLANRPEHARVILLPGPSASPSEGWSVADYVLTGRWPDVVAALADPVWRKALA